MTPQELLAAERRSTEDRLARLREDYTGVVDATRDANSDDEHDPEGQTIAYERSQTGALVRQAEQHLAEIDAASERLAAGTYGTLRDLRGDDRPAARLEVRPHGPDLCHPLTRGDRATLFPRGLVSSS